MKRYQVIGLAALIVGGAAIPSLADSDRGRGRGDGNTRFQRPGGVPGSVNFAARGGDPRAGNWNGGRGDWNRRDDKDGRHGRGHGRRNCGNSIGFGPMFFEPNNANYLGYPPWYRLNYYTPWMSDYENGTAWKNIPTSHAAEGYAYPGYYGAPAAYGMSAAYGMPMAYDPGAYAPPVNAYTQPAPYAQTTAYAAQGNPELVGLDVVVGVQRELRKRGFYRGIVNGISDGPTRTAVRAYESSAGLPITGVIGLPLLRSLGFF